jgi:DNA-binding MarR family transcriptional regulator
MDKLSDSVDRLYRRPGFMLRRAHQIAVSVFMGATAELKITTTQYGVLFLLRHHEGTDQARVARLLGLDRSTTALVIRKLEARGLVSCMADQTDRRRHVLALTVEGRDMLGHLARPAENAMQTLLQPLSAAEQAQLLMLLAKLTTAFNSTARVKLVPLAEAEG